MVRQEKTALYYIEFYFCVKANPGDGKLIPTEMLRSSGICLSSTWDAGRCRCSREPWRRSWCQSCRSSCRQSVRHRCSEWPDPSERKLNPYLLPMEGIGLNQLVMIRRQCDQIGHFLIIHTDKVSFKRTQNTCLMLIYCTNFLGNNWRNLGYILI